MMYMPYFFFFSISLVSGLLISVSSNNWLYVWMGLEINLISFIPIMMSSKGMLETESSLKYFLIQGFGSGILLMSILLYSSWYFNNICENLSIYVCCFSLMMKMGMFPFHFWLPHVMMGSGWVSCMILSVIQKIAPMFILFNLFLGYNIYLGLISGLGSIIGGLGGLNQSQLRLILAYSSIGHMGWMLYCSMYSFSLFMFYFVVYSIMNISIMFIMNYYNMKFLSMMGFMYMNSFMFLSLAFLFMSLGGLPPFLGFYPKMMVMFMSSFNSSFIIMFMLVMGSLMNIFYYLNIFLNLYMMCYFSSSNYMFGYINSHLSYYFTIFMVMMSSVSMGVCFMFLL